MHASKRLCMLTQHISVVIAKQAKKANFIDILLHVPKYIL